MVENEPLESQVKRLASFILEHFPEPSSSDGAIDVAIRLLARTAGLPATPGIPVFVIKATDEFAVQTIRKHIQLCWSKGLIGQTDEETFALAEIIAWQRANPDKVHLPDHEHQGVVIYHADERPHSRACGMRSHPHGPECSENCPTCQSK